MFQTSRTNRQLPRRLGALMVSAGLITSLAGIAWMSPASAATTVGPIDFELPYEIGSIDGQDGWSSTGSNGGNPEAAGYDHAVAAQSLYESFDDQSLRISNAVTSGSFGDHTFSKPLADQAGETDALDNDLSGGVLQPRFTAQWDFAPAVTTPQPGLSVVASPDRGDGSRMSWVEMADTGDAEGLEVNFYDVQGKSDPANFVFSPVASGLSRDMPHTIKITIDFLDGPTNDVVKVYVDDVLSHTGTTWEDYYNTDDEAKPEGGPRTVDSVLFRTGGHPVTGSVPANMGNGFLIDGFSMTSGAISAGTGPEAEGVDYDGNKTCADIDATLEEFKIAGVPHEGLHEDKNSGLEITISNSSSQTFDWVSNQDISAVLVKGGKGDEAGGGVHYTYAGTNDRGDTGLHALVHDMDKEEPYYGISHVTFCYKVGGDDEPGTNTDEPGTNTDEPGTNTDEPGTTPDESDTPPVAVSPDGDERPATPPPAGGNPALDGAEVKGVTLTLPRTGAAATPALVLFGGLGLALGLAMLVLANRRTPIASS